MSRTWAYLTVEEHKQFVEKAERLGMTEGELNQKLIRLFLNTQSENLQQGNCLNCTFYQLATSQLFRVAQSVADFFTVPIIQPKPKNR